MKTKVLMNEDYKDYKQFKIYEVDDEGKKATEFDKKTGEKKDKKPLVNIGLTKAKAIGLHINAFLGFIEQDGL